MGCIGGIGMVSGWFGWHWGAYVWYMGGLGRVGVVMFGRWVALGWFCVVLLAVLR